MIKKIFYTVARDLFTHTDICTTCQHKHRSLEAAEKCRNRAKVAPQRILVGNYDNRTTFKPLGEYLKEFKPDFGYEFLEDFETFLDIIDI